MWPDSSLQCIGTTLIREPECPTTAGHHVPRPGVLWHLQHLVAEGATHPVDLPQREFAFLTHKLKSETGTVGTLKAVTFFKAADVHLFSASRAGEGHHDPSQLQT